MLKVALLAIALGSVSSAVATEVIVTRAKMNTSAPIVRLNLAPVAGFEYAYASPARLTIDGALSDVIWYCVDPLVTMPNGKLDPPGKYEVTTLSTAMANFSPTTLNKVSWLISQGSGFVSVEHTFTTQAAIWSVMLGSGNVFSKDHAFMAGVNQLVSAVPDTYVGSIRALQNTNADSPYQSFGGVVPEPASWALLIAGFGLVGAIARRRNHAVAV